MSTPSVFQMLFVPRDKKNFDLPLRSRLGTEFIVLLIALMTLLSLLSASGSFVLGDMARKWTSGLENSLTIEIPSSANVGKSDVQALIAALTRVDGVESAAVLSTADLQGLLSPWLGSAATSMQDLPLPTLIAVDLKTRSKASIAAVGTLVKKAAPSATVDAHEAWLDDLLRLTNGLRYSALGIFFMIVVVTAIVVGGAVRSRMAIHQKELELLHIMGATDRYIVAQFGRYILWMAGKGSLYGIAVGSVVLASFHILGLQSPETVPRLSLEPVQWGVLSLVPCLILGVSLLSARRTALQVLREMP